LRRFTVDKIQMEALLDSYKVPYGEENAKVWRYVDFAKFVSMLESESLWYCRLDKFEDRLEAVLSGPGLEKSVKTLTKRVIEAGLAEEVGNVERNSRLTAASITELLRATLFVNCWHMSEVESGAMWKIYSGSGIAVQSTIARLWESVHRFGALGKVEYIDYDIDDMDERLPFLYKHRLYSFEQEVRLYTTKFPEGHSILTLSDDLEDHVPGIPVPVDLQTLIESVYVAPGLGGWFRSAVKAVLDRFGLPEVEVLTSAADKVPEYRENYLKVRKELMARGVKPPMHSPRESG
jgi:hypothetical protein